MKTLYYSYQSWLSWICSFIFCLFLSGIYAGTTSVSKEKLQYKLLVKNRKGLKLEHGMMVQVVYTSTLPDGTEIARAENKSTPYEFILGDGDVLKGIELAASKLKVGERGVFTLTPDLAYGDRKFGKVPSNATIIMEIEVIGAFWPYYKFDQSTIKEWPSGLKSATVEAGKGDLVKKGNYVAIHYTGYVIEPSGKKKIFDSSRKSGGSVLIQAGVNKLIKGLDEGLCNMRVGEKAAFIIPASLGYGAKANQLVPANSTLGFDVYLEGQIDPFFDPSGINYIDDPSGFAYCFLKDSVGENAQLNDNVYVNVVGYYLLANGAKHIFESTYEKGQPQHFRLGKGIENPAWLTMLLRSSVGDQVIMAIPPENARMELKKLIPENVTVFFEYTLETIKEPSFLKGEPLRTLTTKSNVKMEFMVEGSGPAVDTTKVVFMHYTGYTIDSLGVKHVFDSSFDTGKPFAAEPGMNKVIKGWEEAMLQMKEGDQVRITVPSEAGYGNKGVPPLIGQNETLYFDLYAVKVQQRLMK